MKMRTGFAIGAAALAGLAAYDVTQGRHAVIRNFPVIGHLRYMLETVGPELRQYIVTDNDDERPFTRDQRRWVYTTAKQESSAFGFGTDNDLDAPGYTVLRHAEFPCEVDTDRVPVRKVLGGWRQRPGAFEPESIVNISAMSFGSLSGAAVESLNRGAAAAGCLHNTGEGGISPHHLHGGDLIWQLGTGYFGARTPDGGFDPDAARRLVETHPVRAIEIKLSQGAKPGHGGILPARKVSPEIAAIRGVPVGITVHSPGGHRAFEGVDGLIDFVERLAGDTGVPVGIKSAVGDFDFWNRLAARMSDRGEGPDFVTIDGGEGGTGAAPLALTDHVSLPFFHAFPPVYRAFDRHGLSEHVLFIGSGKLGLPFRALLAMAVGCDAVNVAREAMLAVGCIQAQRCHTGHCPTGVATQNPWLTRGLVPTDKSVRASNYLTGLRAEIARLGGVAGYRHPADVPLAAFSVSTGPFGSQTLDEAMGFTPNPNP